MLSGLARYHRRVGEKRHEGVKQQLRRWVRTHQLSDGRPQFALEPSGAGAVEQYILGLEKDPSEFFTAIETLYAFSLVISDRAAATNSETTKETATTLQQIALKLYHKLKSSVADLLRGGVNLGSDLLTRFQRFCGAAEPPAPVTLPGSRYQGQVALRAELAKQARPKLRRRRAVS